MLVEQKPVATTEAGQQGTQPASEQSAETIKALQATVEELTKKVNFLSAQKRVTEKPAEKVEPEAEGSAIAEVRKLKEERAKEREKAATKARKDAVKVAIAAHQITGEAAEDLEALVHHKFGSALKNKDDDVVVEDPETGEEFSIQDFISKKLLKGPRGDRYKSAPSGGTNGSTGLRGGQRGGVRKELRELTPEELSKLTKEDRKELAAGIIRRIETGK